MANLRKEITELGLLKKSPVKTWVKVCILFAIVGGFYILHPILPFWWSVALLPITALFTTTLAMTGHEGVHSSACNSRFGNILLAAVVFPLFTGMSMEFWRDKHNVKHHAHPNVHGKDPDIHNWPLAFSSEDYAKSGSAVQFFQRHLQGWFFWPLTMVTAHSMRIQGLWFVISHPFKTGKKKRFNKLWSIDFTMIVLHFLLWFVVPVKLGVSLLSVFLFYVALWVLVGVILSMIFIVGHAARPVIFEYDENWKLQIETGRRIKTGPVGRFFFVGLDYQIEHHLLPSASHFSLPKIAPIVKKYSLENGWEYEEIGFFKALWISTKHMSKAWKLEPIVIEASSQDNKNTDELVSGI